MDWQGRVRGGRNERSDPRGGNTALDRDRSAESVGVTLFRLSDQPGLMLDLNNNDFAVDEDRFRPTPPIEINVRLPENLLHRRLQVEIVAPGQPDAFLAPDKQTLDLKAKSLTLRIDPFTIYQGVVIQTT